MISHIQFICDGCIQPAGYFGGDHHCAEVDPERPQYRCRCEIFPACANYRPLRIEPPPKPFEDSPPVPITSTTTEAEAS